jgi:hypothetical protein
LKPSASQQVSGSSLLQPASALFEHLGPAGTTKNLSFFAFWIQFALSIVAGGILFFSVAFVPRVSSSAATGQLTSF